MRRTSFAALFCASIAAYGSGCGDRIGDSCRTGLDCSRVDIRICDLSNRVGDRGECTIEGCGRGSCPDEAACIKIYSRDFLTVACDPAREDLATVAPDGTVLPPLDDCQAHQMCLLEGLCADEVSARNSCRLRCTDDGDCREGYECFATGADGIYRAPDANDPANIDQTRICRPIG